MGVDSGRGEVVYTSSGRVCDRAYVSLFRPSIRWGFTMIFTRRRVVQLESVRFTLGGFVPVQLDVWSRLGALHARVPFSQYNIHREGRSVENLTQNGYSKGPIDA